MCNQKIKALFEALIVFAYITSPIWLATLIVVVALWSSNWDVKCLFVQCVRVK